MIDDIIAQINSANSIVVIQADNPDGDSLGSALALEYILSDLGKEVSLWCGVDIPDYLKHLEGWSRVSKELPPKFDLSIIVDTSALSLMEKLETSHNRGWVSTKPVIVIDHHADVECDIPYATTILNDGNAISTSQIIYDIAKQAGWNISINAGEYIMSAILADSLGLMSEGTTSHTYRIMADLIDSGVSRTKLEDARKLLNKMPESIFRYKAKLIERTEIYADSRLAIVCVPLDEIMEHSPLYNPAALITPDLLATEGILCVVVIKIYKDKITGAIRCNSGGTIAADLAQNFGGGGHIYAAGFKIQGAQISLATTKADVIKIATELLG